MSAALTLETYIFLYPSYIDSGDSMITAFTLNKTMDFNYKSMCTSPCALVRMSYTQIRYINLLYATSNIRVTHLIFVATKSVVHDVAKRWEAVNAVENESTYHR